MNKDLLIKYIEGNSTQDEKDAMARWLDADTKNRDEFMAMRKTYDLALFNLKESPAEHTIIKKKNRYVYELLKIAAIFAVAFGIFYLSDRSKENAEDEIVMHTLHVPAGQRAELTLSDGTNVWLNAKTTLTFPSRFSGSNREVVLDGEAYFTVRHDPENIFQVKTAQYAIHVLGTEFNVSAYQSSNQFTTELLNGSVEISSLHSNEKIKLAPEYMAYLQNGQLRQKRIDDYDHLLWRKGLLCFSNEPMKTILTKLELYYDVKINVKNNKIVNLPYTGKFWIRDGIEHVIKVLQIHAHFKYEKDSENNMITIY